MKSGLKTSEFAFTVGTFIALIVKAFSGIELGAEEIDAFVTGVLGLVSAISAGMYIWGRVQLKIAQLHAIKGTTPVNADTVVNNTNTVVETPVSTPEVAPQADPDFSVAEETQ